MSASRHPQHALVQHALDPASALTPEVQAHLATCSSCRAEAKRLAGVADALLQAASPVELPLGVLGTLREAITGPRRLERFVGQVASFLDVTPNVARTLLAKADLPEGWLTAEGEGVAILPAPTGPRVAEALATLCRIQPGAGLDEHLHEAPEDTLVLEGGFRDTLGHELWPGETLVMPAGSRHALTALPGVACLCVVLARVP